MSGEKKKLVQVRGPGLCLLREGLSVRVFSVKGQQQPGPVRPHGIERVEFDTGVPLILAPQYLWSRASTTIAIDPSGQCRVESSECPKV